MMKGQMQSRGSSSQGSIKERRTNRQNSVLSGNNSLATLSMFAVSNNATPQISPTKDNAGAADGADDSFHRTSSIKQESQSEESPIAASSTEEEAKEASSAPVKKATVFGVLSMWRNQSIPQLLVFSMASSWIIGYYSLHWLWLIPIALSVLYANFHFFQRSKRSITQSLTKQLVKEKLENHEETANWLNHVVSRFWTVYEPVLSTTIVDSVNPILEMYKPTWIESIRLTEFTLGSESPSITAAKVFPNTDVDIVHADFDLLFSPNDDDAPVSKSTYNQGENAFMWNSKVVLTVRFGKGVVGVDIPIMLKEVFIETKLRVQLKLMSSSPFIKIIDLSMMQPPTVDFILKPLKSLDLMDLPGLSNWLNNLIVDILGSVMVNPNKITLDIDNLVNGTYTTYEKAVGVLKLSVYQAKNLPKVETIGLCDPYVKVEINDEARAKTKFIATTLNPYWNETHFVLVNNLTSDILTLWVMDYNNMKKDKPVGYYRIPLKEFENDPKGKSNVWAPLTRKEGVFSKVTPELNFDAKFYPIPRGEVVQEEESSVTNMKYSGVMEITVHQAKDLLAKGASSANGKLHNPYFEAVLVNSGDIDLSGSSKGGAASGAMLPFTGSYNLSGGNQNQSTGLGSALETNRTATYYRSKVKKKNNSPTWEESFEFVVQDTDNQCLHIRVKDQKEMIMATTAAPNLIGEVVIPLRDIVRSKTSSQKDWYSLIHSASGRLRLNVKFNPIDLEIAKGTSSSNSTKCIGILRINVISGRGMRKIDLLSRDQFYIRAALSGGHEERTKVARDGPNEKESEPNWDETLLMQVKSAQEVLTLELMEYNSLKKDSLVGYFEVGMKELMESTSMEKAKEMWVDIKAADRSKNKIMGQVFFDFQYYAASPVEPMENESDSEMLVRCSKYHGMLTLTLKEGKNIKQKNNVVTALGKSNLFCELFLNDFSDYPEKTRLVRKSETPVWNDNFDFLIYDPANSKVTITVKDQKDLTVAALLLGNTSISLNEIFSLIHSKETGRWYRLKNASDEGAQLFLSFKYYMFEGLEADCLEAGGPLESGILEVSILKAVNLIAVDDDGSSDPYFVVKLNGERIYKSKVIKNTIEPVWNESFEVAIPNINESELQIGVKDWNQMSVSVPLGDISIDLSELTPGKPMELILPLENTLSGSICIRLYYSSGFVKSNKPGGLLPIPINTSIVKNTFKSAKKSIMNTFTFENNNSNTASTVTTRNNSNTKQPPGQLYSIEGSTEILKAVSEMDIPFAGEEKSESKSPIPEVQVKDQMKPPDHQTGEAMRTSRSSSILSGHTLNEDKAQVTLLIEDAIIPGPAFDLNIKVKYNGKTIFKGKSIKKSNNPKWHEQVTFKLVHEKNDDKQVISFELGQPQKGLVLKEEGVTLAQLDWPFLKSMQDLPISEAMNPEGPYKLTHSFSLDLINKSNLLEGIGSIKLNVSMTIEELERKNRKISRFFKSKSKK